jgi:hypothetical protein
MDLGRFENELFNNIVISSGSTVGIGEGGCGRGDCITKRDVTDLLESRENARGPRFGALQSSYNPVARRHKLAPTNHYDAREKEINKQTK